MRRFIFIVAALACACGGATQSDLEAQPNGAGSVDGGSTIDGTTPTPTPTEDGGGTPVRDGGDKPVPDGGGNPGNDGGRVDAGNPNTGNGIWCGTENGQDRICKNDQQMCCVNGQGTFNLTYACMGTTTSSCGGARMLCDDSADCNGNQVCCGDLVQNRYTLVSCRPSCPNPGVEFCDPDVTPDTCAAGTCQESQILRGHYVCR